jgi:hypothetical protein
MKHEFDGSLKPGQHTSAYVQTFSVGCYELVPRADGKGTKRGKVKVRVSGPVSDPSAVYTKAEEILQALDAGVYSGPKTVRVR